MKKIPRDAEASNVLVGEVDFLDKPFVAFVRLAQATTLGGLTEVPVPTRYNYYKCLSRSHFLPSTIFANYMPRSLVPSRYHIDHSLSSQCSSSTTFTTAYMVGTETLVRGKKVILGGYQILSSDQMPHLPRSIKVPLPIKYHMYHFILRSQYPQSTTFTTSY